MPLKRHNSLISLSHDHHHGLRLAALIKKGAPEFKDKPSTIEGKAEYTINFFQSELINHFKEEEEILFPVSTGKDNELDNLIEEILDEHKQVFSLIEKIQEKQDQESNLNKLGELLEQHIRKEERILFTKIQEILSDEELNELGKQL